LSKEAERDETLKKEESESRQLLARCYLKLGQWQENLNGVTEETIPSILMYYAASTEHDSNWYKAWHAWAVMNFETCLFYRQQPGQPETKAVLSPAMISNYAVPALKGFVKSISLSKGRCQCYKTFYFVT
jgi:FKBP12-rapamycin complex-associated protein